MQLAGGITYNVSTFGDVGDFGALHCQTNAKILKSVEPKNC